MGAKRLDAEKLIDTALGKLRQLAERRRGLDVARVEVEVRKAAEEVVGLSAKYGLSPETAATALLAVAMSRVHHFAHVPDERFYRMGVRELDAVLKVMEELGFHYTADDYILGAVELLLNTDWDIAERVAKDNNLRVAAIGWNPMLYVFIPPRRPRATANHAL